jgi:hypothetical protein
MVRSKRSSKVLISILMIALIVSFTPVGSVRATDHGDSPTPAHDQSIDIGDVYFFLDPNDPTFAVMAVTVSGFITPSHNANRGFFGENVRFRFEIENTGDTTPDRFWDVTFTKQTSRTITQNATVAISPVPTLLPAGAQFVAPTTISRAAFGPQGIPTFGSGPQSQQVPTITPGPSGVSFFAGLIDDPCFYDLGAELAYRNSRFNNMTNPAILTRGRDSYAGHNTMAVALRVPVTLIKGAGDVVGLSVAAQRRAPTSFTRDGRSASFGRYITLDRMANPLINTIMTSYVNKDRYNRSTPQRDAVNADGLATDIVATLQALQTNNTHISIIAQLAISNGDYLRLDTSIPNTGSEGGNNMAARYPNGRRPNDDVVDIIITLINNGVSQGDAVNDNEMPFKDIFPFFAQPHMPFPPAADDLTRH